MWAVLASLHPLQPCGKKLLTNPQRVAKYTAYENDLNFEGLTFPIKLHDIPKFEKLNNLSVNVYTYSNDENTAELKIFPILLSHMENSRKHIHLFLV